MGYHCCTLEYRLRSSVGYEYKQNKIEVEILLESLLTLVFTDSTIMNSDLVSIMLFSIKKSIAFFMIGRCAFVLQL